MDPPCLAWVRTRYGSRLCYRSGLRPLITGLGSTVGAWLRFSVIKFLARRCWRFLRLSVLDVLRR